MLVPCAPRQLSILLALALGLAWAPDVAAANKAKKPRVEIVTAGSSAATEQLEAVLRELIGPLPVRAEYDQTEGMDAREVVTPRPGAPAALARVWLDLSNPSRATVYVVDGPWERILVRHVPLKGGVDEVAREQLGHIVSATVDALANGARIGLTREEVERDLFGARPERRREKRAETTGRPEPDTGSPGPDADYSAHDTYEWHGRKLEGPPLDLGLYYEAQAWTRDHPFVHGPLAALHVGFRDARNAPGLWLMFQYRLPISEEEPPIGVRLYTGAVRALGTLDLVVGRHTHVRPGLGLGFDVVTIEPRQVTTGEEVDPTGERTKLVPMGRGLLALQHRIFEDTTLTGALALDVDFTDSRYVVERGAGSETVFDPWIIRPGAVIGISTYLIAPP